MGYDEGGGAEFVVWRESFSLLLYQTDLHSQS